MFTELLKALAMIGAAMFVLHLILYRMPVYADPLPPQLTYCSNGSEVVIVENHTCPPGYWPI